MQYVAYYRVSTKQQENSHLGIEGQQESVRRFIEANNAVLLCSYTEVETGKKDTLENRPILQKAISHARRSKAVLLIAKLDRLSRSVYVTAMLHKSGVEFVACDMPIANRLTVQILAAVAENETRMISERTKTALQVLKSKGTPLGAQRPECRYNLSEEGRTKGQKIGAEVNHLKALEAYQDIFPEIKTLREQNNSFQSIADYLNEKGHTTRTGRDWSPRQVSRVLEIYGIS